MHGINPKAWFYALGNRLRSDQGDRIILTGAACEQWINGLLFRVIAERLPNRLTAYPEWKRRQHDIAVLPVARQRGQAIVDWKSPVIVVENKVIYWNYPPKKRDDHVDRLLEQLQAPSTAQDRVGLLLAAYVYRPNEVEPDETFSDFRRDVWKRFNAGAKRLRGGGNWKVTFDHDWMETVLDETRTKVGGEQVVVACAGQYVRVRTK